jgi:hypothetical protein
MYCEELCRGLFSYGEQGGTKVSLVILEPSGFAQPPPVFSL